MTRRLAPLLLFALAVVPVAVACAHEELRPSAPAAALRPGRQASAPSPYVVADPSGPLAIAPIALGSGQGVVVEKRRVVLGNGEPRVAHEMPEETFVGAVKAPARFGGGFLFWTANTIYRAASFDGDLAPLVRTPETIDTVSFAPKALLVRTHNGERWGIGLPKGERAPITPVGVADVQALDDGRLLAFTDAGAVLTSVDGGATLTDVTAQVRNSPTRVEIVGDDLWLLDNQNGASRLERDGRLAWFDKPPDPTFDVRPRDPRWHGTESPLHTAFHGGAAIEGGTQAVVIVAGDVVRIDLRTGTILSVVPGRLPPESRCEAVPGSPELLFACLPTNVASAAPFVVARVLAPDGPVIEHSFGTTETVFYASDDGGLAFGSACDGASTSYTSACVRQPGGTWEPLDLAGYGGVDGGIPSDLRVARWVPRADGRAVAVVVGTSAEVYDPVARTSFSIPEEIAMANARHDFSLMRAAHAARPRTFRVVPRGGIVDSSWSFAPNGVLRGYERTGQSFEIDGAGRVSRSIYTLSPSFAGALALGRTKEGRLFQTQDHGASWTEVAAPPGGVGENELAACSTAGCDLGAFYRVGWSARPPAGEAPRVIARPAPEVRRSRGTELACRATGAPVFKAVPRTANSPEDLGMGAVRLGVASDKNDWGFVRNAVLRSLLHPVHDAVVDDADGNPGLRALFSGFGTTREDGSDVVVVSGPNRSVLALRRAIAYAPAFDPAGRIQRATLAVSDVALAARRAGMTMEDVLSDDPTETGNPVFVLPADPNAPSDLAMHNVDRSVLTLLRGERARVAMRTSTTSAMVTSAVMLPADETAYLEVDSTGAGRVFKVGPSGAVTDLFEVNPQSPEGLYPANPDALAIGPKGELVILRTPSGSDPASALDPAFVSGPALAGPEALAPWSELKLEGDPACKDRDGYRAVVQTVGPWIRTTTPELRVGSAPGLLRVRWSARRVCLEGFEVATANLTLRVPTATGAPETIPFSSWIVGRGSSFARVAIGDGVEWRQALECSVVATGP